MDTSAAQQRQSPAHEIDAPVLRPGDTCWRLSPATRATLLVDGADYYDALSKSMRKARRSIFILGWDFDSRINLQPDIAGSPTLGGFLRDLVERNSELEVRILVWSAAVVHAPSGMKQLLVNHDWADHPRITVKLDTFHPIYGAHHQKLVSIDDSVAFSGGIDLTVLRWDSHPHELENPHRRSPEGEPYEPMHDVQMAMEGPAAADLAELARDRWRRATGEKLPACAERHDCWPTGVEPDFRDHPLGIARTYPQCGDCEPVAEIARLTAASLKAARRLIYIEQQYMTASFIGNILCEHLANPDGPEIMVLMTRESRGVAERFVMGSNRDRLIRRLKKYDRFDRLRVCFPVVRGADDASQVMIHSKFMIIDDWFMRVGSANLNNRSMGLDSECDIAIEARDGEARAAIERLRRQLISEHLAADATALAAHEAAHGSMLATIDAFNVNGRGFACFAALTTPGPTRPVPGTSLLDPKRPFEPLWFLRRKKRRP